MQVNGDIWITIFEPAKSQKVVIQITDIQKHHQTWKFPPGKSVESGMHPIITGPADAIHAALQSFCLSFYL